MRLPSSKEERNVPVVFDPSLVPDASHAPSCYWFWHSVPTQDEITSQIDAIRAAGYGSFQIQARRSFPMGEYLGGAFLSAYRFAVMSAKDRGLRVGVYDDYNWQSGHAGGRVVAQRDSFRERHLFWSSAKADGPDVSLSVSGIESSTEYFGEPGMSWHYDGAVVRWSNWEILAAVAVSADGRTVTDIREHAEIVSSTTESVQVKVAAGAVPVGATVSVFVAATCSTSRLPNYLDPEAIDTFLRVGYEPFFDTLGEFFGDPIDFFFFDQPHANFYTWAELDGNLRSSVPISAAWWQAISAELGDELPRHLHALVSETAPQAPVLRNTFYRHHGQWSRETFFGSLRAWTQDHGVKLSGHEVLGHVGAWPLSGTFSDWDLRINFGLDYFALDSYRDLTAVDAEGSAPQLSAKMGDSVARSNGRSRTIVEQYFGDHPDGDEFSGHWGLTLTELRRAALRNHVLGMRQMVFHGFYQTDGNAADPSVLANPRFDFAPGINFEPWFADYHASFALESGRLSHFLDEATPSRPVAVLYPLATLLADGLDSTAGAHTGAWCERLFRAGVGYDIVPEEHLDRISDCYQWLIVPAQHTWESPNSTALIAAFQASGGRVVTTGMSETADQWSSDEVWTLEEIREHATTLDVPVRMRFDSGEIAAWVGSTDTQTQVVAFNESDTRSAVISIDPLGPVRVRGLDLLAGTVTNQHYEAGPFEVVLQPNELYVADLTPQPNGAEPENPSTKVEAVDTEDVVLDSGWIIDIGGTTQPIEVNTGWETQGHPHFSGTGNYSRNVDLTASRAGKSGVLTLPAVNTAATVWVNDTLLGARYFAPYRFTIPNGVLIEGTNRVTIAVTNTAANRYYGGPAHHRPPTTSGLGHAPLLSISL